MSNLSYLQPLPSQAVAQETQEESYYPMLQNTGTNKFRLSTLDGAKMDKYGNLTVEQEDFKLFLRNEPKLSTGAKKLFDLGCVKITEQNNYRAAEGQPLKTGAVISLKEYGRRRGYDLTERETTTPEEKQAELKRLDNVMHEIRKRVNSELKMLFNAEISFTDTSNKKKTADYRDIRILQEKGISGGYINMVFTERLVSILVNSFITSYPMAIQKIDERNDKAYRIATELYLQHGNDNNRAKKTNDIISVKKLLEACGDIPTFEEVQASKDRGHWERRIKDPLEKALDYIARPDIGVITKWEYCNSKKLPLTSDQIEIEDYQTFTGLYVHFIMEGEPDQTERLQRKAERKTRRKPKGGGE